MICAGPQPGTCAADTSPRRSQWRWGVEDNFCVSPLRHRGQSGHRPRMDMLEKSQDQQRKDLEQALAAKSSQVRDVDQSSPPLSSRRKMKSIYAGNSPVTSRLHHVRDLGEISAHAHRRTKKASKTNIH